MVAILCSICFGIKQFRIFPACLYLFLVTFSDLEDKFQTYNKLNGAIKRHFGKQMNKETKLRIHNITAKEALKSGSEAWVLKKREEQRLEVAQMKFLRQLLGITKLDKENNQCIREKNEGTEHSTGNKTVPEKVATTRTEDGHK